MFEAVHIAGEGHSLLCPDEEVVTTVHFTRHSFMKDLLRYFKDEASIRRQVELDAPRCRLEVGGVRTKGVPSLPSHLLAVCTQAVLGLPLELLHMSGYSVLEVFPRPSQLFLSVHECGSFTVMKRMLLLSRTHRATPVLISLRSEGEDVLMRVSASGFPFQWQHA